VAPSNAVRQFHCEICSKGYSRQPDYENHLRSYDHTHRQRLADMKKLTARSDVDNSKEKKRGPDDMRAIPVDAAKKVAGGPRFTRVGAVAADAGRFKKVGVSVGGDAKEVESTAVEHSKADQSTRDREELRRKLDELKALHNKKGQRTESPKPNQSNTEAEAEAGEADTEAADEDAIDEDPAEEVVANEEDEDVVMGGDYEDEEITWEEYDFTKPNDCDHASCPGCKVDGIWDDAFEPIAV
jgi:hypothetical protein